MEEIQDITQTDDTMFAAYSNLWTLPKCSCLGIKLLKHIVDSINNGSVMESVLIVGHGKDFAAQAFSNSIFMQDVRVCKGQHFDQGFSSYQFFNHSTPTTAHIIEDVQGIKPVSQAMLWKYLKLRCCFYYRGVDSTILHCNGMVILTADNISRVPKTIVNSVDHIAYLAPHTRDYLTMAVRQYFKFCGIGYSNRKVIAEILKNNPTIRQVIQTLKTCMVILKSQVQSNLTVSVVKKAIRMNMEPTKASKQDEIPF
jgi:hypothetical protein